VIALSFLFASWIQSPPPPPRPLVVDSVFLIGCLHLPRYVRRSLRRGIHFSDGFGVRVLGLAKGKGDSCYWPTGWMSS
jgi:hypothetical protein